QILIEHLLSFRKIVVLELDDCQTMARPISEGSRTFDASSEGGDRSRVIAQGLVRFAESKPGLAQFFFPRAKAHQSIQHGNLTGVLLPLPIALCGLPHLVRLL